MAHAQAELLSNIHRIIERLVPLVPDNLVREMQGLVEDLEKNPATSPEQVRQALVYIGQKEYPYRKAYQELCAGDEEARLQEIVLHKLDDATKALLDPVTTYGVHILDFVKSSQFEALDEGVKVLIDNAIREAHDVVNRQCDERAEHRASAFQELVNRWKIQEDRIVALLDLLREMADRNPDWQEDILARVAQFEDDFFFGTEPVTEDVLQKEIASWSATFGEGDEGDGEVE